MSFAKIPQPDELMQHRIRAAENRLDENAR